MSNNSINLNCNPHINNSLKNNYRLRSRDKERLNENPEEEIDKSENSNDSVSSSQKTRKTYSINQKLEFVNKELKEGLKKTSRNYGIGLTSLRRWIKNKNSLEEILNKKKRKNLDGAGRIPLTENIEDHLCRYYKTM